MKPTTAPPEGLTSITEAKPGDILAGREHGDGERAAPFGVLARVDRDPWKLTIQGRPPIEASGDWRLWVVTLPKAAQQLLELARRHDWKTLIAPSLDHCDHLYVTIHLARSEPLIYLQATWHTHDTGTLRLTSKIWRHVPVEGRGFDWRDAPSLRKISEVITGEAEPA
ncbi:hypothetical protein GCM10022226_61710 [Sphaerisporangium flaviroseum]|uniref:Uncharacterized protein n=1 Tax=Sphaerisporangium flaviroseum TaxID=509199 RepID=A0ABP7J199_9ACTN